jgi:hypothetical protein
VALSVLIFTSVFRHRFNLFVRLGEPIAFQTRTFPGALDRSAPSRNLVFHAASSQQQEARFLPRSPHLPGSTPDMRPWQEGIHGQLTFCKIVQRFDTLPVQRKSLLAPSEVAK